MSPLKERVLEAYGIEQIDELMMELGSAFPLLDQHGHRIYQTICHNPSGGKHKLYYYPDSHAFYCYSECGSMDLFQFIMTLQDWDFKTALHWLAKRVGVSMQETVRGFVQPQAVESLGWIETEAPTPVIELPHYSPHVLTLFSPLYPKVWKEEGISSETAEVFDLRFDLDQNKAIIPYRDIKGDLIGIRGRSFNAWEVEAGYKYMPIKVGKQFYKHPIQLSLYGIYEHQEAIRSMKHAILFEGEKSVMIHHSWYGAKSTALGLGGIHLSQTQRHHLLALGVETVWVGLDHDFCFNALADHSHQQVKLYLQRLSRLVKQLTPYFKVELLLDLNDTLPLKGSPVDAGKDVYEQLVQSRYFIEEAEELESLMLI